MKGVEGLIRLHRWQLDEKRRALVEIERLREDLLERSERLEREIAAERQVAGGDTAFAFGAFAEGAIARRATIARSLAEVEGQITRMREQVAEAFQDLKKYEILQENRARREQAERARRQGLEQDEIGLQGFRRREGTG